MYDKKIDDLLREFHTGDSKVLKSLTEFSRKEPLLMLRKLPRMSSILEASATMSNNGSVRDVKGVITGQILAGPRDVRFHGRLVKLSITHWGFSFLEPLWIGMLDVFSSMPCEVLFTCGLKVGLLEFLGVYLQLMSVQLQLLSANKADRLKGKLTEAFAAFRQYNASGWKNWLRCKLSDSEVRHVLMSCNFISPQEASEAFQES